MKKKFIIILLISSLVLVLLSLTIPVDVNNMNESDLKHVELGYPLKFVVQDWSQNAFAKWAKNRNTNYNELKVRFLNPLEIPTEVKLGHLFMAVFIVFLVISFIAYVYDKRMKRDINN